jgi:hypothetical protein
MTCDFRHDHDVLASRGANAERRHGATADVRMSMLRGVLDVLRIEIPSRDDHQILQPAGDDELPLVNGAEVSGTQEGLGRTREARAEHLRRLGIAPPVS